MIIMCSILINAFTYMGNKTLCVYNESNNKTCLSFNESINTSNMERLELNNPVKSVKLGNLVELFTKVIIYVVLILIVLLFILKIIF